MMWNGFFVIVISFFSPPRKCVSSSYTILIRCSFLLSPFGVSSFNARSLILALRSKTSLTFTSACKRERWISLMSSLTSFSSTKTAFAILDNVSLNELPSLSSTIDDGTCRVYLKSAVSLLLLVFLVHHPFWLIEKIGRVTIELA